MGTQHVFSLSGKYYFFWMLGSGRAWINQHSGETASIVKKSILNKLPLGIEAQVGD